MKGPRRCPHGSKATCASWRSGGDRRSHQDLHTRRAGRATRQAYSRAWAVAEELRLLLDRLRLDRALDVRDAAILSLGWAGALRRSELVSLDWAQLGAGGGWPPRRARTKPRPLPFPVRICQLHATASRPGPHWLTSSLVNRRRGSCRTSRPRSGRRCGPATWRECLARAVPNDGSCMGHGARLTHMLVPPI
jgi:integrase